MNFITLNLTDKKLDRQTRTNDRVDDLTVDITYIVL